MEFLTELKKCQTQLEEIKTKVEMISDELIKSEIEENLFEFDIIETKKISKKYNLELVRDLKAYQRQFRITEELLPYANLGDKLFLEIENYLDMGDIDTALYVLE